MTSRAFWQLVDRLRIRDDIALDLIEYPGKLGESGKRPRFRLSTRQSRLAAYLAEIDAALRAIDEDPLWLGRRNRAAPFSGAAPIALMAEQREAGIADVLRYLNRAILRKSLGANARQGHAR